MRTSSKAFVTVVLGLCLAAFASAVLAADQPAAADASYLQSFDKWKAELVDDLKQNWLPLAGLFWLKPGENKFGSDAKNDIVFPKGPAHAGSFTLQSKDVSVRFEPGVQVTVSSKPFTASKLEPDVSGHATVLEMGSLRFHVIVRGERIGIRLKDTESDAARGFRGLDFFPVSMNYRLTAKFEPSQGKKTVDVPNVLGDVAPTPVAGTVVFTINGQELRLSDLGGDPANGLFFVFSPDQQDRDLPWRAVSGDRAGSERNGRAGLQPRAQSALRGNSLCHLPRGAERKPLGGGDTSGREVQPQARPLSAPFTQMREPRRTRRNTKAYEQTNATSELGGWPCLSRLVYSRGWPVQALLGRGL